MPAYKLYDDKKFIVHAMRLASINSPSGGRPEASLTRRRVVSRRRAWLRLRRHCGGYELLRTSNLRGAWRQHEVTPEPVASGSINLCGSPLLMGSVQLCEHMCGHS